MSDTSTSPRTLPVQRSVPMGGDAVVSLTSGAGTWEQRLTAIVDMMREMSRQTDPQTMVQAYGARIREFTRIDRFVTLSRRGLAKPKVRITRSSTWDETINPWKSADRLPVFEGGLLAELIYGDVPVIIDELNVDPSDPAAAYFEGMGSLMAIPNYDVGEGLNMVLQMRLDPRAFDRELLPEQVWMSNLFGRATKTLVLSEQVKAAYDVVDRELKVVADIQRSLLPETVPNIPTLEVATYYQTSRRAGGDYYDFFPLSGGRWGILIADVSGHGTPAAVLMAVTHSIAHTLHGEPYPASDLFKFVNKHLYARYTAGTGTFVTAFYAIYDPATRKLTYSSAGHNPPRLRRASGQVQSLDGARMLPLGISADEAYFDTCVQLAAGDVLLLYTDGITEARHGGGVVELFGVPRLDAALTAGDGSPDAILYSVLAAVDAFAAGEPPADDRTLLVAAVK